MPDMEKGERRKVEIKKNKGYRADRIHLFALFYYFKNFDASEEKRKKEI